MSHEGNRLGEEGGPGNAELGGSSSALTIISIADYVWILAKSGSSFSLTRRLYTEVQAQRKTPASCLITLLD